MSEHEQLSGRRVQQPAQVVRRLEVGAVDDPAERESDDVSAIVASLLDRPTTLGAAAQAGVTRIRRTDGIGRAAIRRKTVPKLVKGRVRWYDDTDPTQTLYDTEEEAAAVAAPSASPAGWPTSTCPRTLISPSTPRS